MTDSYIAKVRRNWTDPKSSSKWGGWRLCWNDCRFDWSNWWRRADLTTIWGNYLRWMLQSSACKRKAGSYALQVYFSNSWRRSWQKPAKNGTELCVIFWLQWGGQSVHYRMLKELNIMSSGHWAFLTVCQEPIRSPEPYLASIPCANPNIIMRCRSATRSWMFAGGCHYRSALTAGERSAVSG